MQKTDNGAGMNQTPTSKPFVPETPVPGAEKTIQSPPRVPNTPRPGALPQPVTPQRWVAPEQPKSKREAANSNAIRERCRQIGLSLFFREQAPVKSLGFTSSIAGEGKTFLTMVMANSLANDSLEPVTLMECNWEHPSFHEYFGIPQRPGLAEWLRGECSQEQIRYNVSPNLTVIPAGEGRRDAVRLLQLMRRQGLQQTFGNSNELFVVDLPPVVTTAYGSLAAGLVDSLLIVARAGVTTDLMITETCAQLKDLPVEGVILNQMESRIPRWIRQLM